MAVGCAADISRAAGDVFVTSLASTVYSVDSANRSISQRCAVACAHASPCAEHVSAAERAENRVSGSGGSTGGGARGAMPPPRLGPKKIHSAT